MILHIPGTSHDGISVTAWSPSGRALSCPVHEKDGVHTASFQPDEIGEWSIAITHKGTHIQGGPFTCFVFDPNGLKLLNTEGAMPGQPFSFIIDASSTGGLGDVIVDIVREKQSIPHTLEDIGHMRYRVCFFPRDAGKYRVYMYFNGADVRGSPFSLRVGMQKGGSRRSSSTLERTTKVSTLERTMNGLNLSSDRSSPMNKSYKSTPSPPAHITTYSTNSLNHSLFDSMSPTRELLSPPIIKETNESFCQSSFNRSKTSSGLGNSPSFLESSKDSIYSSTIKESKDIYSNVKETRGNHSPIIKETVYSSTINNYTNRSRSPSNSPTVIKESKDIYESTSTLNKSKSFHSSISNNLNKSYNSTSGFNSSMDERDYNGYARKGPGENGFMDNGTTNIKSK